ncbi:hypothetical protein F183_A15390 [Bryobacterales bacterium F-183]|nr:hypothetical protein F183_A15390 [Bryobacterales bacterium F-183]
METRGNFKGRKGVKFETFGGNTKSSTFAGLILVAIGVALLLQNFGILRFRDILFYWPLAPLAWGVHILFRSRSLFSYLVGGLIVSMSAIKLLDNLDIINVGSKFYGPLILIGLGVVFLARNLGGGRVGDGGAIGDDSQVDQPHINPAAVFGGVKRRVVSQQLESGEVMAMFGGVELDFRPTRMKGNTATVEVNAIFGGIKMRIPETWNLEVRGSAVFGGFEDKTIPAPASVDGQPAPKLILTGNAIFGGVEVEN